jgi:Protein of unknown function (DUF4242)
VGKYMIERQFHVGQARMPEVGRRSRELVEEQFPEIVWEHSHVAVEADGGVRSFCLYVAPSEDVVRAHAKELGLHDVLAIYEIAGDITPADFPPV